MIYKKNASFPYPILTNDSSYYKDGEFTFDVNVDGNSEGYRFEISYNISSNFIKNLLDEARARLVLVIQSVDNQFYYLENGETFIEIPKSKLSLDRRTKLQLSIQVLEEITFAKNMDLEGFYNYFKDDIIVKKSSTLGFSNVVTFDGSDKKPFDLFEKQVDEKMKPKIKIELGTHTIIIKYKNEDLQFRELGNCSSYLNNIYVYMGLQKALFKFIKNYGDEDEFVNIEDMEVPEGGLDEKLYTLMSNKHVETLDYDHIDDVIDKITDNIIGKYTLAIRGLSKNGD
ncbi:MAG: hypothetical protein LBN09_06750 [Clostridioides sp.]|jgi:hypothetical protein|nr:hypothetical protein [Clostridioides sp.]